VLATPSLAPRERQSGAAAAMIEIFSRVERHAGTRSRNERYGVLRVYAIRSLLFCRAARVCDPTDRTRYRRERYEARFMPRAIFRAYGYQLRFQERYAAQRVTVMRGAAQAGEAERQSEAL